MKKILILFTILLSAIVITNCSTNEDVAAITEINYIGFETVFEIKADIINPGVHEVKVSTSNTTSADRVFNISVDFDLTTSDPSSYSIPATVTVPANSNIGTFNIEAIGANVNESGDDMLVLKFEEKEGLYVSDPLELSMIQYCSTGALTVDIQLSYYSTDTSWEIKDSSGNVVESKDYLDSEPYGADFVNLCLPAGDYTFTVYDTDCYGFYYYSGHAILSLNGNIIFIIEDKDLGCSASHTFTLTED